MCIHIKKYIFPDFNYYNKIEILENLQKGKKMIKDFRPGVLGITEKLQVKLLDFGIFIFYPINTVAVPKGVTPSGFVIS